MHYEAQKRNSQEIQVYAFERLEKMSHLKKKQKPVTIGVNRTTKILGGSSKNSTLGLLHSSLKLSFFLKETGTQSKTTIGVPSEGP